MIWILGYIPSKGRGKGEGVKHLSCYFLLPPGLISNHLTRLTLNKWRFCSAVINKIHSGCLFYIWGSHSWMMITISQKVFFNCNWKTNWVCSRFKKKEEFNRVSICVTVTYIFVCTCPHWCVSVSGLQEWDFICVYAVCSSRREEEEEEDVMVLLTGTMIAEAGATAVT